MRDPDGKIIFDGKWVIRKLNESADQNHFLRSSLAKRLVEQALLMPYEWIDEKTLKIPRLGFVTYPNEWSEQQFYMAASLTLKIQSISVSEGWDLKDASVWNIVFDGLKPIFVDHLSFVRLNHKYWKAGGQFTRHFIFPLVLGRYNKLEPSQCIQLWRDGVPTTHARSILGHKRFLTPFWFLMIEGNSRYSTGINNEDSFADVKNTRAGLISGLEYFVKKLEPRKVTKKKSVWSHYESERKHYTEQSISHKKQVVSSWLTEISPKWVLDIGCNAGEFSDLAVSSGAKAICWDADPNALAALCFRHAGKDSYFPILSAIDDLTGGRGWIGKEYSGLPDRLHEKCDVAMLLAVIHHLSIACAIRYEDLFCFINLVTSRYALLEILSELDEKVIDLCEVYGRNPADFSVDNQYDAIKESGFKVINRCDLVKSNTRHLVLLEKIT